jgi:hypothetical protein
MPLKRSAFMFAAILALLGGPKTPPPPMSVCDFVAKVKQLDGRFVAVRGIVETFSPNPDEFYVESIIADSCAGQRPKKIRVRIDYPDVHFLKNPPPEYQEDRASFLRARGIVAKAQRQGRSVNRLFATIQGIAYAPGPESRQVNPQRRPEHGSYDAAIVIQAIRDVTILNK